MLWVCSSPHDCVAATAQWTLACESVKVCLGLPLCTYTMRYLTVSSHPFVSALTVVDLPSFSGFRVLHTTALSSRFARWILVSYPDPTNIKEDLVTWLNGLVLYQWSWILDVGNLVVIKVSFIFLLKWSFTFEHKILLCNWRIQVEIWVQIQPVLSQLCYLGNLLPVLEVQWMDDEVGTGFLAVVAYLQMI